MQRTIFAPAGPEYGIRRDGKTFAMTCLSLRDAKEMAFALGKDGAKVEVFDMGTGQVVATEAEEGVEAPPPYGAKQGR